MENGSRLSLASILIVALLVHDVSVDAEVVEGDILLPESNNVVRSNSIKTKKWIGGHVPYVIDKTLSTNKSFLAEVKAAMDAIQSSTSNCIHFFPKNSTNTDYINITTADSGCYSSIGRIGGVQLVNIGDGCDTKGIIIHELLHALGFWHEQSRTDRDNFVDIKYAHMILGTQSEFDIRPDTKDIVNAVRYDFHSILHYKYNQFAKVSSWDTIVPNAEYNCNTNPRNANCVYKTALGQRIGLSRLDIERIQWLYECKAARHDCQNPSIDSMSVIPSKAYYAPGSVIDYKCDYSILVGPKYSTCLPGKKWSGALTRCLQGNFFQDVYYCDFAECVRHWYLPVNYTGVSWKKAWNVTLGYGPDVDHTYQTNNVSGSFLMFDIPSGSSGKFYARTPVLSQFGTYCMMFYYYMYGAIDETSTLMVMYSRQQTIVQTGSTKEPMWYRAIIKNMNTFAHFFADIKLTGGPYGVAIDDVLIGSCQKVDEYIKAIDNGQTSNKQIEYDTMDLF